MRKKEEEMHKEQETERKKRNEFFHSSFDFEINDTFKTRMKKCRAVFQFKQALPKSQGNATSTNEYCCKRKIEIGV